MDCPTVTTLGQNEQITSSESQWILHSQRSMFRTYGGPMGISDFRISVSKCCSWKSWQKRLPISFWIRKYSLRDLRGDMIAGITVGITVIPQALAYSQIAELPLEYGLYSSFMGCFMYALFGTSKDLTLGTTAIISLLTAESFPKDAGLFKPQYAVLLCFFTGILQFLMGALNLGFLINFISAPVISGFTTASAFVILYGQVKSILGISFGRSTDTFIQQTKGYIENLRHINGWDVLVGCSCIGVLLTLKGLRLRSVHKDGSRPKYWTVLRTACRIISVARYGTVVIVAGAVGFFLEHRMAGSHSVTLTKNVHAGLPSARIPVFEFNNKTFTQVLEDIGSGLLVVPVISILESLAISKAFAKQFHYNVDPTQEFLALGVANFVSSFVSSYPVTGSFTKSALNAQSGVRTPMGCVFTGAFVLISVSLFSSSFRYLPQAALGAIIICAVSMMFELRIFYDLWILNKKELLPLVSTIAASLFFGVDYGLLAGICFSLILLLYPLARPAIDINTSVKIMRKTDIAAGKKFTEINVTPQGALFFPSVEYIKEFFEEDLIREKKESVSTQMITGETTANHQNLLDISDLHVTEMEEIIVFNGIHLLYSDYSTLRGLRSIVMSCKKAGKTLKFINTPFLLLKVILPKELREDMGRQIDCGVEEHGHGALTVQFSRSLPEQIAYVSVDHPDADPTGDLDAGFYVES